MTDIIATMTCPNGHSQTIRLVGMSREWAENWVGLVDGRSPFYIKKPADDPKSSIGKCATCGSQIDVKLEVAS